MEIAKPEWLEQMEAVLETLNEGILISDDCDHVLFVNSVFEEMTGISRADILGRDAAELYYSPGDFAVLQELRKKTRQAGRGPGREAPSITCSYSSSPMPCRRWNSKRPGPNPDISCDT